MEKDELPEGDLERTLIVHGIPRERGDGRVVREILAMMRENYNIKPLLVGRFNRCEHLWRILFSSVHEAERFVDESTSCVTCQFPGKLIFWNLESYSCKT